MKYDTGYTANVTVNSGAVWNLTADTSIGTLVNNGIINTNGYTLTTTSTTGSGTINSSAVALTIGSIGWATLYTPVALDFSSVSGLTAYTASFGSTISLTEVSQVPARTAVILKGNEGSYTIPTATTAAAVSTDLVGTATGLVATSGCYVLAKIDDSTVGFKLVESGTGIPGGKGYYFNPSAARTHFTFDGESTAISSLQQVPTAAQPVYDLQGRTVKAPVKGLYIIGGKKIIRK